MAHPTAPIWILVVGFLVSISQALYVSPETIGSLLLPSYDYIVVGAGIAGLVVANRLTEDNDTTVLVLEAGELDTEGNAVTIPGLIGDDLYTMYDWNFTTVPQDFLDNQTRPYNAGRVVGGGSILNGLVWTRGSSADYDAWETLNNPGWGWNGLLPYFMKSEAFSVDLSQEVSDGLNVHPDMLAHGTSGPVSVTYPNFIYNQSQNVLLGLQNIGIDLLSDPNSGNPAGAMIIPSSMSPQNQSRADARSSYLDAVLSRPNLHLAPEQTVTRLLLFNGTVVLPPSRQVTRAMGVEFAHSAQDQRSTVNCSKEIILAAGAIVSPVLLQVSGIGPANVSQSLGIPVAIDLPGVGNNLQDHGMVGVFYNYTNPTLFTANNLTGETLVAAMSQYCGNRTGPLTAPLISTVAFPPLSVLPSWRDLLNGLQTSPPSAALSPDLDPTVRAGYNLQQLIQTHLLERDDVGAYEIMADSMGHLTISMQKPFSRGTVRPSSADLLAGPPPLIDPRYCSATFDCDVLLAALRLNDQLIHTPAMQALAPNPPAPFCQPWITAPENATDVMDAIRAMLRTEFHPCGTTAMMPREWGGVVDPALRVHGTANVRVVDAGIFPMIPGAHIQAAVYAVAEKAADLIKNSATCSHMTA